MEKLWSRCILEWYSDGYTLDYLLFCPSVEQCCHWNVVAFYLSRYYCFFRTLFIPVKLQKMHLLLGGLILLGIYFLVPAFDLKNSGTQGLLIGLFSALAYALRNLILKKHNAMGNGSVQMIYQLVVVVVLLAPVLWLYPEADIISQWPYLFILGAITTALGHTLFLSSFSHFNISTASIMSSIQPLFGVLLGALFLYEIPTLKSVIGGALILTTVLIESKRSRTKK